MKPRIAHVTRSCVSFTLVLSRVKCYGLSTGKFLNGPRTLQANRLIGLECLAQCARSFAQSHGTSTDFEQHLARLLEPVFSSVRKGNIASHPKQLAVVHQLCLECMPHAPQYITQLLVMLIKHDSWEYALEGVRATFAIMTRSASRLSQIPVFDEVNASTLLSCFHMPPPVTTRHASQRRKCTYKRQVPCRKMQIHQISWRRMKVCPVKLVPQCKEA